MAKSTGGVVVNNNNNIVVQLARQPTNTKTSSLVRFHNWEREGTINVIVILISCSVRSYHLLWRRTDPRNCSDNQREANKAVEIAPSDEKKKERKEKPGELGIPGVDELNLFTTITKYEPGSRW